MDVSNNKHEYSDKLKKYTGRAGAIFIALALWQLLALYLNQSILLVSPLSVLRRLTTIWREAGFFSSIWFTFRHIMSGFVLGWLIGSSLAVLSSRFSIIETLLWPYIAAIKSVPVASIVVIALIWFSPRNLSVFVSFLIVMPFVYQNLISGIRSLDPAMEEMSRIFHLSLMDKLRYVILPQLSPYLISAASVTVGLCWKAGAAAEIIGTPQGSVGKMLYLSKVYLDTDDLLAWTVIIVILSVITEKCILFIIKRWLLPYQRANKSADKS